MTSPKIVIVGAGPAGITLARLLQQHKIPVTIYEGDAHQNARNQGGSLDLHVNGGQLALAEAGLLEEFKRLSRPEGECSKILDPAGNVLFDENTTSVQRPAEFAGRPEIDRTVLRDLLVRSLEPGTVHWGKKIARIEVEAGDEARHTLHLADGTQERGVDLVVGADGAFSKVRPLLTAQAPEYSGITAVEFWKEDVDASNPWLAKFVGRGTLWMFDEGRFLAAQRQQNAGLRVYAALRVPFAWKDECGIDWTDAAAVRERIASEHFGDCGGSLQRMVRECDGHQVVRPAWMLPVGHTWDSKPGVTLIGDAAHVMTPFAGVGVNVAMADALDLAQNLVKQRTGGGVVDITTAIRDYEQSMFVRAEKNAKKTYAGLQHHFRAGASQEWAEKMQSKQEALSVPKTAGLE